MIIKVTASVCLASGDDVTATHEHAWTLREGVLLFQSSLHTHAAEPHAAQSHNPRSRARKLESNGHFETTRGISPCAQEPQHFSPARSPACSKVKMGMCWFRCHSTTLTSQFEKSSTRGRKVRLSRLSFIHSLWNNFIHCGIFNGSSNADWSSRSPPPTTNFMITRFLILQMSHFPLCCKQVMQLAPCWAVRANLEITRFWLTCPGYEIKFK